MTTETKERGQSTNEAVKEGHGSAVEKQSRIPRSYESIEKGALALELKDRVELKNKLDKSIDDEVQLLEAKLSAAKLIVDRK